MAEPLEATGGGDDDPGRGSRGLKREAEALLFAAGRPLGMPELLQALSHARCVGEPEVEAVLAELAAEYPVDGPRGFELARVAGGWVFRTNGLCATALDALFASRNEGKLSSASLETLAIVAYLQPVSRREIAEIRGVASDSPIQTLLDRDLVMEVGRANRAGTPVLFGTTERFQIAFGLESLDDLPPVEGFELRTEQREELRRRLGSLAGL